MVAALALRAETALDGGAAPLRTEVLARYRRLREISKLHNSGIRDFLSTDAILQHARRLGLTVGRTLVFDNMEEMTLAFDLAIHTAPKDRSRAIDRYARSASFAPESDEALVLETMRRARFAVLRIVRRHEAAGLIVRDVFRRSEHWLVDEGLETSMPDGAGLATRFFTPEPFAITAGVIVPLSVDLLKGALAEAPPLLRKRPEEMPEDRRFAEAIYRVAIAGGTMDHVAYRDPLAETA